MRDTRTPEQRLVDRISYEIGFPLPAGAANFARVDGHEAGFVVLPDGTGYELDEGGVAVTRPGPKGRVTLIRYRHGRRIDTSLISPQVGRPAHPELN